MAAFILFCISFLVFLVSIFNPIVLSRSVITNYKGFIEKLSPRTIVLANKIKEKNKYFDVLIHIIEYMFRWPQIISSFLQKKNVTVDNAITRLIICLAGVGINTVIIISIGCLLIPTVTLEFIQLITKILQGEGFSIAQILIKILDVFKASEMSLTEILILCIFYIILNFYYLISTYSSLEKLDEMRPAKGDKNITLHETDVNCGNINLNNFKIEVLDIRNAILVLKCINIKTISLLLSIYIILKITNLTFLDNFMNAFSFISISVGTVSYAASVAPVHATKVAVNIVQFVNELIKERELKKQKNTFENMKDSNVFGNNKKND